MNTLIAIILSLIIVFTPIFIYLWKQYMKPYAEKQWILRKVKILYKVYSKACMNVYLEIFNPMDSCTPITVSKNSETYIDKVYIHSGLCAAVSHITKTNSEEDKILYFLADHIDICDLKWKTTIGIHTDSFERYKEVERIHSHRGGGIYWFPIGDVVVRRDFLKRVLIQHGKLVD